MTDMADEDRRDMREWAKPYTGTEQNHTPLAKVARYILDTVDAPVLSEDLADIAERCEMWTADAITEALTAATDRAKEMEQELKEARAEVERLTATFKEHLKEPCHLPSPQIIRTVEELEDLDPDTLLIESDDPGDDAWTAQVLMQAIRDGYGTSHDQPDGPFPAVVVTPAEQVRAARNALQKGDRMTDEQGDWKTPTNGANGLFQDIPPTWGMEEDVNND